VRNLIEKARTAKIAPPPDRLEDQVRPQQMLCNSKAAITSTGQRNHPHNSTAIRVLLTARERAQFISAPDVTWACAWCLVWGISHQSKFVNHCNCEYSVSW